MTDRIKGITIEIGGDITGLSKALAGINKEMHAPCHHTAIQKGTQTPRGSSPVAVQWWRWRELNSRPNALNAVLLQV